MNRRPKSYNRNIVNGMIRSSRRNKSSVNLSYFVLYAFLYKYLSDNLKYYLSRLIDGTMGDIKRCYADFDEKQSMRENALNDLGYFIENFDALLDQLVGERYVDEFFIGDFLNTLKENIVFSKGNPASEYFDTIIDAVDNSSKFYMMDYDNDLNVMLIDYIYSISKLDLIEDDFTFQQSYNQIAFSRIVKILPTPEYISHILTKIVSSQKEDIFNVYDPFLRDASTLLNLSKEVHVPNIYGKEGNRVYYIYGLIRAFIEGFDFRNIFFYNQNAIESTTIEDMSFDAIVSKIPNRFRDVSISTLKSQNLEIPKNVKNNNFRDKLFSNLDLNQLKDDDEIIEALNVIEEKMAKIEKRNEFQFYGEYESLLESDYLFIINMINSLRDNGIMAISVSQNFLFKKSLTTLRKFLTYENNYIDAIISLPEELSRSIRPEVIIVFRKDKNTDNIVFIDLSKDYGTAISRNMLPGVVRRNLILDSDTINKILDVYSNRKTMDKFSEVVDLRELEKNEFNLTVSRYVDTYEGEYVRLEDLIDEKKEITENISRLTKEIDEMMNRLNIKF